LTFLLEAADDIAYATADLEDAFKKGLFTIEQFIDYYQGEINKIKDKDTHFAEEILVNLKERIKTNEDIFSAFQKCMNFMKWLSNMVLMSFQPVKKPFILGQHPLLRPTVWISWLKRIMSLLWGRACRTFTGLTCLV